MKNPTIYKNYTNYNAKFLHQQNRTGRRNLQKNIYIYYNLWYNALVKQKYSYKCK